MKFTCIRAATCSPLFLFNPKSQPLDEAATSTADSKIKQIKAPIIPLALLDITIAMTRLHLVNFCLKFFYEICVVFGSMLSHDMSYWFMSDMFINTNLIYFVCDGSLLMLR